MAINCSVSSIYLDIGEHIARASNHSYRYGLYVGLGAPSQNGSLWPSITQNETVFRTENFCASDSSTQCADKMHEELMPNISVTWRDNATYQSRDDTALYSDVTTHYGRDILNVWMQVQDNKTISAVSLTDFPVTLVSNYTSTAPPNLSLGRSLGLGSASTVLERLYQQKLISSRSYGLFVGTRSRNAGAESMQNGSLDLGGYDAARFTGPVHTYTQSPVLASRTFSPFKLRVAQMSLNYVSGRSVNLTKDGGFDAYLTTNQYPLRLPRSVTQMVADNLAAAPANNTDNTLRISPGFEGNMTVTLDDGLVATFDSTWLSSNLNISPISAVPIQNSSFVSSNSTGFASRPADVANLLGVAFLQQLYLIVSYDTAPATFSLAQANPSSKYFQQQTFCPGVTPQPVSPANANSFVRQGMIGAVLGGVIGGLAFIVLLAFVLRFTLRKWLIARNGQAQVREIKPRSRWDDLKNSFKVTKHKRWFDVEAKQDTMASKQRTDLPKTRFVPSNPSDHSFITAQVEQQPPISSSQIMADRPHTRVSQSSPSNQSFSGSSSITEIENVEMIPSQTKPERLVSLDFGFNNGHMHEAIDSDQVGWSLKTHQQHCHVQDTHSGWASSVTRRSLDAESCSKSSMVSSCHSSVDQLWRSDSIACSQISQYKPGWRSSSIYSRE